MCTLSHSSASTRDDSGALRSVSGLDCCTLVYARTAFESSSICCFLPACLRVTAFGVDRRKKWAPQRTKRTTKSPPHWRSVSAGQNSEGAILAISPINELKILGLEGALVATSKPA